MRALISVSDKTGLEELARGLVELGCELVASGGTATLLGGHGLPVTRVEDVTGAPELFEGRVKTLHPRVHGGILARLDEPDDVATLEREGIEPFDLVVVNLYPFRETVARLDVTEAEAIEKIDIGGPALLRAAAKNFEHVAPVPRPDLYPLVLDELRSLGATTLDTRRHLAAQAFAITAAYESAIVSWFAARDEFPPEIIPSFVKVRDLAYGENPHQRAAFYAEAGVRRHLLSRVEQLHGRELSYNNLNDLESARRLAREFSEPACVIVKHANPCGAAVAATAEEAYELALAADPLSAYGGVVLVNRPVAAALGARIAQQFVEVLLAPGYDDAALEALTAKPDTRILDDRERRAEQTGEWDYRRVLGGVLVQERDSVLDPRTAMEAVCGVPTGEQWDDLLFAWSVCRHVSSNAIVIAKGRRTIGIGAGQMSRVDAVRIALEQAREHGHDLAGAALASDAFFPFADGPQLALDAGVTSVIQPGGSLRDDEVIAAADAAGLAMVFTGMRHFRH